jgi:hypothetical protein
VFRRFVEQTGGDHALMGRVIPNIMNQDELDRFRNIWPLRNYIVALYRTQYAGEFDDAEVLRFVQDNRAPAVSMWWRDRDPGLRLGTTTSSSAASPLPSPSSCRPPAPWWSATA